MRLVLSLNFIKILTSVVPYLKTNYEYWVPTLTCCHRLKYLQIVRFVANNWKLDLSSFYLWRSRQIYGLLALPPPPPNIWWGLVVESNGQLSQPTAKIWDNFPNPPPNLGTIVQTHCQNSMVILPVVKDISVTGHCMLGDMVSVIQWWDVFLAELSLISHQFN